MCIIPIDLQAKDTTAVDAASAASESSSVAAAIRLRFEIVVIILLLCIRRLPLLKISGVHDECDCFFALTAYYGRLSLRLCVLSLIVLNHLPIQKLWTNFSD